MNRTEILRTWLESRDKDTLDHVEAQIMEVAKGTEPIRYAKLLLDEEKMSSEYLHMLMQYLGSSGFILDVAKAYDKILLTIYL